nr:reverse transcriptase domain-containing protein [Tanacetum cinerariifolium]
MSSNQALKSWLKEASTLGEIVSLEKSNKNVIGPKNVIGFVSQSSLVMNVPGPCSQHERNQRMSIKSGSGNEATITSNTKRSSKPKRKAGEIKRWTPEAKRAFKNMKKYIAKLPMVTVPKPKEELIMYLCTAREAVRAVLLMEKDSRQVPVYFVPSRALQTPKINYNSMEKLVLALVHATRRLRRYFQAYPMVVIMDQPIKQIMSRPKNTRIMLKWKFKLEAFDITYRSRISICGQILADFITERLDGEGPSMEVQAEEVLGSENKKVDALEQNRVHKLRPPHQTSLGRNTKKKVNRKEGNLSSSGRRMVLLDDTAGRIPYGSYPAIRNKEGTHNKNQGKMVHHGQRHLVQKIIPGTMVAVHRSNSSGICGMPSIRCAKVNQAKNDKELLLNLDILEERRDKAAVCEARNKAKMKSTKMPKFAAQASAQEILSTVATKQAMPKKAESWVQSGKDVRGGKSTWKGSVQAQERKRRRTSTHMECPRLEKMLSLIFHHVSTPANVKPH